MRSETFRDEHGPLNGNTPKYISKNTIQPTAEDNQPFGTDKSVPYEHVVHFPIHPTFANQVKNNILNSITS